MRAWLMACLCLVPGLGNAAGVVHDRGDFQFTVAPEPGFVVRHPVPASWPADAPGADDQRWRYWLHDIQADRRTGADAVYSEHVYEPKARSMLGEAGRFQVSFNPGYQRLLVHRVEVRRDGEWQDRLEPEDISLARRETGFERDLADGQVTALIVLDDVRVEDLVRVSYTVVGSNPILAGQSSDWMRLGWVNPQLDSHFRVLLDPGTEPGIHLENGAPQPVVERTPDAVEVRLHAHATEPVVNQDNYPTWYQPFPLAQVTARRTWGDVVDWALPLYPAVDALPPELEARVADWRDIAEPREQLQAALRAVQDEVRYFGVEIGDNTHRPVEPGVTWQRRYGDCKDKAYLLVTLLERLGIEAAPALVSIDRGRALADHAPTAAAFDHVIVRARIDGEPVWVDPTMTQQGGDPGQGTPLTYGVALPIVAGVDALVPVEAAAGDDSGISTTERFTFLGEGEGVELSIRTTYRGVAADNARRNLSAQRTDDLSRRYADYYRTRYGELEVVAPPALEDDRDRNVLVMSERYRLAAPFDEAGPALRELEVYAESLQAASALPSAVDRNGPLAFASRPSLYRHEVVVDVPDDWDPTVEDEEIKHESEAFTYTRALDVGKEDIKLVYQMQVKQMDVPLDATAAHLRVLREARDSLSVFLRFVAPRHLGDEERKQRLEALIRGSLPGGGE